MVAKVCSISQGQPAIGSRSAAIISTRRRTSLEGCMGGVDGFLFEMASGAANRTLAAALSRIAGVERLKRERNGLASLRRVDHSHVHLLTLGEMRNAGRTQDRDMDEYVFAAVLAGNEAEAL